MILLGTTAWVISRPRATAKLAWSSVAMDLPGLFPSVQLSKPSSWTCRIATELSLELHSPARTPWWYSMILDDTRYSMIGMIWQLRCMIKDASKPDIWANACLMPAGQQRASPVIVAAECFYPRKWQDATHLVVQRKRQSGRRGKTEISRFSLQFLFYYSYLSFIQAGSAKLASSSCYLYSFSSIGVSCIWCSTAVGRWWCLMLHTSSFLVGSLRREVVQFLFLALASKECQTRANVKARNLAGHAIHPWLCLPGPPNMG